MALRQYAHAKAMVEREDTDEDALTKAGIPAWLITEVMENIRDR